MIDVNREHLISFAEAARRLSPAGGRPVRVATLARWCIRGCRGVELERVRIGARYMTSAEALQRFVDAVNAADRKAQKALDDLARRMKKRSPRARQVAVGRALDEVAAW